MPVAAKTRESTSSSVEIEGTCVSKNFDETVRLQSQEKKDEWIQKIRAKILQGIAKGTSSSSAASFPGRNGCSGTHCSLIVQERK